MNKPCEIKKLPSYFTTPCIHIESGTYHTQTFLVLSFSWQIEKFSISRKKVIKKEYMFVFIHYCIVISLVVNYIHTFP